MPPPAGPSPSMRASSACIASILDLSSAACFISPKKSAIGFPVRLFAHSARKSTSRDRTGRSFRVIAGLDRAIHAELHFILDHRVKPGGDEAKESSYRLIIA